MLGGAVFLGQYFQIGRGYSPTEAGLLTIPMMAGVLLTSSVAGRLISASGRVKPYILAGTILLVAGFALLSTIDHQTSLVIVGAAMFLVGRASARRCRTSSSPYRTPCPCATSARRARR